MQYEIVISCSSGISVVKHARSSKEVETIVNGYTLSQLSFLSYEENREKFTIEVSITKTEE